MNRIGTLQESHLHAALKTWYARPGDDVEVALEGFVIDVQRGAGADMPAQLIEIQTRSFSSLQRKLAHFLPQQRVHVVHPIAQEKWIVRRDAKGLLVSRRKSPRRGQAAHLFQELVNLTAWAAHPNFSLEIVLTREEEILRPVTRSTKRRASWRRKGWRVADRVLLEVVSQQTFTTPADFAALLPASLPTPFTTRDLAQAAQVRLPLAQKMAYCLHQLGVLARTGKRRQAWLYARASGV